MIVIMSVMARQLRPITFESYVATAVAHQLAVAGTTSASATPRVVLANAPAITSAGVPNAATAARTGRPCRIIPTSAETAHNRSNAIDPMMKRAIASPRRVSFYTLDVATATNATAAAPAQTSGYVSAQRVTRRTRRWWSSDIKATVARPGWLGSELRGRHRAGTLSNADGCAHGYSSKPVSSVGMSIYLG